MFESANPGAQLTPFERAHLDRLEGAMSTFAWLAGGQELGASELADGFVRRVRALFGAAAVSVLELADPHGKPDILARDGTAARHEVTEQRSAVLQATPIQDAYAPNDCLGVGLPSVMRARVTARGETTGVVVVEANAPQVYQSEDRELLKKIASAFGATLARSRAARPEPDLRPGFRDIAGQAEEMVILFDAESHAILDANACAARTLEYAPEKLLTLRLDDIATGSAYAIASDIRAISDAGELHLTGRRFRTAEGTLVDVDLVASPILFDGRSAIFVLARDVSDSRETQRQAIQSQKLESLGEMAGQVAHDFNNLLTTILGFSSLLRLSANLDASDLENVGMIETAARRAADVTGSLLSFSRGGLTHFGPLDLRTVLTDTLRLFAPAAQPGLHIRLDLPPAKVLVEGDRSQLQQAILNILLNARDAMPDGGNIAILLDADGDRAILSIGDDGPGMSDETRTRIFEPFYTTKPQGTGTGLGMSITYGIVQAHHGRIQLVSAPGAGATFTIQLPAVLSSETDTTLPPAGKGLVLIVDSDEPVRRATAAALTRLGYNVVQASSGEIAIRLISARPERFAAVLLDTADPDANAITTQLRLADAHPRLPVIACSTATIEPLVSLPAAATLLKPYTDTNLALALQSVAPLSSRL